MKKVIILAMLFSASIQSKELNYHGLDESTIKAMGNCCTTQKHINKFISRYYHKVAKKMAEDNPGDSVGLIKANSLRVKMVNGKMVKATEWLLPNDIKPFDRPILHASKKENQDESN